MPFATVDIQTHYAEEVGRYAIDRLRRLLPDAVRGFRVITRAFRHKPEQLTLDFEE